MYIKTLQIRNIRAFENTQVEFSPKITVIAGVNNSGKSTIIRSLYTLQFERAIHDGDLRKGKDNGGILIKLENITGPDQDFFTKAGNSSPAETMYVQKKITGEHIETLLITQTAGKPEIKLQATTTLAKLDLVTQHFKAFNTSEDKKNFIFPFFSKRKPLSYHGTTDKARTYEVREDLQNLPIKVAQIRNKPLLKEKYAQLCKELIGYEITANPAEREYTLGAYVDDESSTISIDAMGDGIVNIVGIITYLLSSKGKLLLIEELENDLHPLALKRILELIISQSEHNQIIISTHSSLVLKHLGSLPETKIIYTDTTLGENSFIPTSTAREISNEVKDRLWVLEQLGYDYFDFGMYEGYLIFEESSAETIVRDILIPEFFPELKLKIRTIAAQGAPELTKLAPELFRLFLFIHSSAIYTNRAWVIADGDDAGKKAIDDLKEKFSSWGEGHFIALKKNNLEDYYPECIVQNIVGAPMQNKREIKKKMLCNLLEFYKADRKTALQEFEIVFREWLDILKNIKIKLGHS